MMEFLEYVFPVSGVKTNILIPPLVALVISLFTSAGGVSGAFLLLPYQVSVLHYTSPSVSGTNLIFNIVAIPAGVYRFIKEGRMVWPLAGVIIFGTLPGIMAGYFIRVLYLPDPARFKIFMGCVLLLLGGKLLLDLMKTGKAASAEAAIDRKFGETAGKLRESKASMATSGIPAGAVVRNVSISAKKTEYEFMDEGFSFSTTGMAALSFIVGIIGGIYGIGGGAIIAPFCVSVFRLPVYTVAGPALLGTLVTSVAGVLCYSLMPGFGTAPPSPDWLLGTLFGIGGAAGIYSGARLQKYIPQRLIKLLLCTLITLLALNYVLR